MAKTIYYITAKFETFIKLTKDYDDDEKKKIIEDLNWLPSCEFSMGPDEAFIRLNGSRSQCVGSITGKEVGKLIQVNFEGCFMVDPSKRRDKAEVKLEAGMKNNTPLFFEELSVANFMFNAMDSKGKEVGKILVEGNISTTKPSGVEL